MTFEEKLRTLPAAEVWEEYCGFLEMTMEEYKQYVGITD